MAAQLLLAGAGPMARAYHDVVIALGVNAQVVGRGQASAEAFAAACGVRPATGGLKQVLAALDDVPDIAIVALPVRELSDAVRLLASAGVRRILVEKPGGLTIEDITRLARDMRGSVADIRIGYNRRFYGSTRRAREIISADGGPTSLRFEFTEFTHRIEQAVADPVLRASWFLANSSHVVDLAFHLAGEPDEWHAVSRGGRVEWHPVDRFAGSGMTVKGAVFSYCADWNAPGRWGVEIMTPHHRLTMQPLEELRIGQSQEKGEEIVPATPHDQRFKPGLLEQVRAFLGDGAHLPTIHEHAHFANQVLRPMMTGRSPSTGPPLERSPHSQELAP